MLLVIAPWVELTGEVDVVVECDGTVAVCCIELLADTAEDTLLIPDPPLSAVDVEFSESGVEELFEEDSKGVVDGDCADAGVDDDNVDELVTGKALLKLESPPSGVWVVGVEFSGSEVAEPLEEDSKGVADGDCADIGVDDDDVDELVTADDEFVASVIVNWITSIIQRNPRSIVVMKTFHEKYNKCEI